MPEKAEHCRRSRDRFAEAQVRRAWREIIAGHRLRAARRLANPRRFGHTARAPVESEFVVSTSARVLRPELECQSVLDAPCGELLSDRGLFPQLNL